MDAMMQYQEMIKPEWSPPAWLFGPVWTALYAIMAVSFGTIFYKTLRGKLSRQVATPFGLNLIFNFAFTPIQFGLQNNVLASLDILLVLGTLAWAFAAAWSPARWVVLVNIPYFLWVVFATTLQLTITYLNL